MAYSNQTTHYGLPLPVGSDKSTWLDTNVAFQAIDSALYSAAQTAASQSESISTLQSQMTTANANISANATAISTEASTREAQDTAHSTAISNINSKLGNTSLQGHGDGTVTGILMDIVRGYDALITGHTPKEITIGGTPTTGVTQELELYVDDYFISLTGIIVTAAGGIEKVAKVDGSGYALLLGTISAQQISEHFTHLQEDTQYSLGRAEATVTGTGIATTSGNVNARYLTISIPVVLVIHNGTGYLYLTPTESSATVYNKTMSTTEIGKFADSQNAITWRISQVTLRVLSYYVPDVE